MGCGVSIKIKIQFSLRLSLLLCHCGEKECRIIANLYKIYGFFHYRDAGTEDFCSEIIWVILRVVERVRHQHVTAIYPPLK